MERFRIPNIYFMAKQYALDPELVVLQKSHLTMHVFLWLFREFADLSTNEQLLLNKYATEFLFGGQRRRLMISSLASY